MATKEKTTTVTFAKGDPAAAGESIRINTGAGAEEFAIKAGAVDVPERLVADVLGSFSGSTVEGGTPAVDAK